MTEKPSNGAGGLVACPFVWVDLEMTGFYPDVHTILEIAVVVTDANLNVVAKYPNTDDVGLAIRQPEWVIDRIDPFALDVHTKTGLLDRCRRNGVTMQEAEYQVLTFLSSKCARKITHLCGNSVWQDRLFLRRYMSELESFFHYRLVDVSSVKELVAEWCPAERFPPKEKTHRAMVDILASIEELKHYRRFFPVQQNGGKKRTPLAAVS